MHDVDAAAVRRALERDRRPARWAGRLAVAKEIEITHRGLRASARRAAALRSKHSATLSTGRVPMVCE